MRSFAMTSFVLSWHDTQPVYSCDFQPLPVSQLKRILNFPSSTPASTPSFSAAGVSSALAPPASPVPSHSDPVAPSMTVGSSASTSRLPSEAPGADVPSERESSVCASATAAWKGKEGEHSTAPVLRQYRLATAGADKHVRVSHVGISGETSAC